MKTIAAICLAFAAAAACAGDYNMDVKVTDVSFGKHISGPNRTAAELADRVVLVEFWSITCPPCVRSLSSLSQWQQENEGKGLVVIGIHCSQATPEQIKEVLRSKEATHSIFDGGTVRGGTDFRGIPHVFLFDHTGKCIYRGSPFQVSETMKEALAAAPAAAFAGVELVKLKSLADSMKKGALPATVLQKAQTLASGKEEELAAEAKLVVDSLTLWGQKRVEAALAMKDSEPVLCMASFQKIAREFSGTQIGKEASKNLTELKADTAFMNEIKAWQTLERLYALEGILKPVRGTDASAVEKFRKKNQAVLMQMIAAIRGMKKNYPDSPATAAALKIAEAYDLPR
ncbi:MAG TPA: TlpA disulfide reductase family protein [Planctomycetota bacterium]|nr:TlpA disulfide reductase family protein [Planctomycetota bacterium]